MSPGNTPNSSSPEEPDPRVCRICGGDSICEGLGVIRYDVPVEDPRFGKLFRCPNNPVEIDVERQERLRRISNLDAYADKSFHNFVVDRPTLTQSQQQSLQLALNTAYQFAENPNGWLLLQGSYGCGKTHLAAAVGNERLKHGDLVLFITVPDLLDHLRSTYGPSSEVSYDEMFERMKNAPLFIVDDLGAENSSPWAQEKLFQLFNHRYNLRLPTVITTNADLDRLDPRMRSRLLDSTLTNSAKITAPDYRTYRRNQDDLFSSLPDHDDQLFENFELRKGMNQEQRANLEKALHIARDYAEDPSGQILVILGGYSTGKTHLAAAIAHYRQQMGEDVMFVTVTDLLDHLRVAFSPDAPSSFGERFQRVKNASFLVLDDLGTENATPWAKEKLFQIIDFRYVKRLPTVITSAKAIEEIEAHIRQRLLDTTRCTIFSVNAPDWPTRAIRK